MIRPPAARKLLADSRGVAMVEFAIVASLLFTVSFGAIGLGMVLWTQSGLQAAAAEAARCGAIQASGCTSDSGVQSYALSVAKTFVPTAIVNTSMGNTQLTINVNSAVSTGACPAIPASLGSYETVQIITPNFATWLPPPFGNMTIAVCASYAT